jgi:hypothetical protein
MKSRFPFWMLGVFLFLVCGLGAYIYGRQLPANQRLMVRSSMPATVQELWPLFSDPLKWPQHIDRLKHADSVKQISEDTFQVQETPWVSYKIRMTLQEPNRRGRVDVVDSSHFEGSSLEVELVPEGKSSTAVKMTEVLQMPSPWARLYFRIFQGYGAHKKMFSSFLQNTAAETTVVQ